MPKVGGGLKPPLPYTADRPLLEKTVLVLNQNYEPLSVCSVRRALLLILRGKAEAVER